MFRVSYLNAVPNDLPAAVLRTAKRRARLGAKVDQWEQEQPDWVALGKVRSAQVLPEVQPPRTRCIRPVALLELLALAMSDCGRTEEPDTARCTGWASGCARHTASGSPTMFGFDSTSPHPLPQRPELHGGIRQTTRPLLLDLPPIGNTNSNWPDFFV